MLREWGKVSKGSRGKLKVKARKIRIREFLWSFSEDYANFGADLLLGVAVGPAKNEGYCQSKAYWIL